MEENSSVGVLILAGGLSERMPYPKPWLRFNSEQTFTEKIVDQYYRFGVDELIVVLNEKYSGSQWTEQLSAINNYARIVINGQSEKGRSYSLHLGLELIRDCSYAFVQNIDNPFVDVNLLTLLAANSNEKGYTVPVHQGKGGHPILISRKIIHELRQFSYESLNLREFLKNYPKIEVETSKKEILANINTEEDYKAYFNRDLNLSPA
ncbi:MAG TPA: hypothetical protein DCX54_01465 [Flavobacteriales bacterium]|nr:hypothetical protein [Flavobacteriales bacterium]